MHVSIKWLREFVDVDLAVEELVERLDMTGTAVEGVRIIGEGLSGVVVGQVLNKAPHPEADKLTYCEVDVGSSEPLHIVCGATSFEAGDKVPVACAGTELPGGLVIKRSKLRGLMSEGMMCSAPELGLPGDGSGLLVLPQDAPVGVSWSEYAGRADTVIDLEVTPNRPDCLSMVGVAREVAAITGARLRTAEIAVEESAEQTASRIAVVIEDAALCKRYAARLVRGVRIGPSPEWLAEKVAAAGARPVNNIVDITNYVMFELGQPLHAFDASTLATRDGLTTITVRTARADESLVTLDGQLRTLTERMLVIADDSGPVALAGVMGGEATEVSESTFDVVLESACFDPASVSTTSRSLGLISEASTRFERGVDPNGCVAAIDRAAALMAEIAGGVVTTGAADVYPAPVAPKRLTLRISRLNAVLGTAIAGTEAARLLEALGFTVFPQDAEVLLVEVPTFRPDIEREIDLIEEVVRVWGMDRVCATLPAGTGRVGVLTDQQRWMRRIDATVRAAGLNETMTYSFIDPEDAVLSRTSPPQGEVPVELANPMSAEQAVMRWSLLPGLLRAVSYNQRRGVPDVQLYEIGATYGTSAGRTLPRERTMLAAVLAGSWTRPGWNDPGAALDFFDGKGVIEALAIDLGIERLTLDAFNHAWLQPGRSSDVFVDSRRAGWLGEVHPQVAEAYEAQAPIVAFELDLAVFISAARAVRPCRGVPRFPAVTLDLALVVDDSVTADRVERAIRKAGGMLLDSVRLFDVYRGPGVARGRKSLAWALTYRAPDRTLSDDDVRPVHEKLVRKVSAAVGAELRG